MRFTLRRSPSLTSVEVPSLRLRLCALEVSMWRRPEWPRFTLPVAVFLKRLAAPLWVFNFGIVPLCQLPANSFRLPVLDIQPLSLNCFGIDEPGMLSLRYRIRSLGSGRSRRRFLFLLFWRQLSLRHFFLQHLFFLFGLRLLLGFFFAFLLSLDRGLLRWENRVQRIALLPRPELHDALRFHVLNQPLQNLPPQPGPRHFTAAEKYRGLYFVALIQEAKHVVLLGLVIVVVHIDAELDLFYGDRLLVLLGLALFLFLLVKIFPVVHDAAHGRLRGGRNLNQVKILAFGQFERFEGRHYADLFTFVSDHANFAGSNAVIGSDKAFIDTVLRALSDWEYKIITWGLAAAARFGRNRASLKPAKHQFFQSHPAHLPKVALLAIHFQPAFASVAEGRGHFKHGIAFVIPH